MKKDIKYNNLVFTDNVQQTINQENRLINKLFTDSSFFIDFESVPYIVRDIINMNWWNTCEYLIGYKNNHRIYIEQLSENMKIVAGILKEFYRYNQSLYKDEKLLIKELKDYILGKKTVLRQLKLFSMEYRRNDSQYYYKDGKPTWLDCTSRVKYSWIYIGQNGYIDFDGKCRLLDAEKIIVFCKENTVYPHKNKIISLFSKGENLVKKEIFSQRYNQYTVEEWINYLNINIIPERKWLFNEIKHVKTDPSKNNERKLLKQNKLYGHNEEVYGYTILRKSNIVLNSSHASHASRASRVSDASAASDASRASRVSDASHASRASDASAASDASRASRVSEKLVLNSGKKLCWFDFPNTIGKLDKLDHPPFFQKNKFGIAGHWKIDADIVNLCKLGWFDPYSGWGGKSSLRKKI